MTTRDVLVVGAGPTGLTVANVLARGGVGFRILDTKPGPTEESRALVMHARSLELLDKLGLADRAVEEGQRMGAVELLNEGRRAGRISFLDDGEDDRTPYPFVMVYEQSKTERLLIRGLEEAGGRVEWGTELLSLAQTSGGVRASVRRPDGSQEIVEVGWVVGADGARSQVRRHLGLGFEGDTYEQTLFLADVELEWELGSRQAYMDLTRAGFLGFFPMPGERRFRLLGSLPPELAERDEVTLEDVRRLIDANSGLDIDILEAHWTSVYRTHHRMAERFRVGRAFLVGDAAHIHSPAGGQGMNTGIGDAYNLAWKLALVARGQAQESLLDSYEAERIPFARSILKGSDRGFHLQATTNSAAQRLKLLAVPPFFRLVSLIPPLRRRVFWLISQLWTSYRNSPAVAQSGPAKKGPRAGDRAPHGLFEAGPDVGKSIFEVLGGPDHHLLVFEGRRPANPALPDTRELEETLRSLLGSYEATVHMHPVEAGNRRLHERYGADAPSLFLVRPDGHLAYRGRAESLDGLKSYLDGLFEKYPSRIEQNVRAQSAERSTRS